MTAIGVIPVFVWVFAVVLATVIVTVFSYLSIKRGVRASVGKGSIVIAGTSHEADSPMGRALIYVQQWMPNVQQTLFSTYLRLMKDAGADVDLLADYDDARFAKSLFRYIVSGGNGTPSMQKIVENAIINGEWKRETDDVTAFVRSQVWPLIERAMRDFLNAEYDTTVLQMDGTRRTRWVSNTDFVDAVTSDDVRDRVVKKIVPIFEYAQKCVNDRGCE